MNSKIYITPISSEKVQQYTSIKNTLGSKIDFFDGNDFEEKYDIAILGVKESRGGEVSTVKESPNYVREHLYELFPSFDVSVLDLGNILAGETAEDTFFAVSEVIVELIKKEIVPIIIGGSQELTYAIYKAYEKMKLFTNIVTVDRKIDFQESENINSDSYLKNIILSKPNYLFNYSNICSQSYYLDPETEKVIQKLFFENIRLGEIQKNIEKAEPIIRNCNILSFDMNSIRQAEVPGTSFSSPNGLFGNEACQITRYAGMSDKLAVIGFFEMTPEYDINGQTSHLLAQMIWYFMEGFSLRKGESPLSSNKNYLNFKVILSSTEEELVFIKSKKSNRWWMKIPYPPSKKIKFERHHIVPCNYEDYQTAQKDEMPDLWITTYNRININ